MWGSLRLAPTSKELSLGLSLLARVRCTCASVLCKCTSVLCSCASVLCTCASVLCTCASVLCTCARVQVFYARVHVERNTLKTVLAASIQTVRQNAIKILFIAIIVHLIAYICVIWNTGTIFSAYFI